MREEIECGTEVEMGYAGATVQDNEGARGLDWWGDGAVPRRCIERRGKRGMREGHIASCYAEVGDRRV
jgi:hypothetical protein